MIDIQEARARLAFAKIDERRRKEKAARWAAQWRLAVTIGSTAVGLAAVILLQKSRPNISTADLGGIFFIYIIASATADYRANEKLRKLRAELDELRDEIRNKAD